MQLGNIQFWKGRPDLPKVICLHGFLGNGEDFAIVADHYPNRPDLLAPNLPDYTQEPADAFSWDDCILALDQFIESETQGEPCILLGYSMGARIALQYAVQNSSRLCGLVLVGGTPGIENDEQRQSRIQNDLSLAKEIRSQPIEAFLDNWFKQGIIKSQELIPEPYRSRMKESRAQNSRTALAEALTTLGTGTMNSAWNALPHLNLPTLLITGETDEKFELIAKRMSDLIANASHATIKHAGHACCFEQPAAFCQRIEPFIANFRN